jgi:cyclopropane fatty-acyl-phospholipid synthase-like methyltransferase
MDRWQGTPSAARPFPPVRLRYRVHGQRSLDSFVGMGTRCFDAIERALQTHRLRLDRFAHILDFGCGCGRIFIPLMTRYPALDVSCTDTDSEAIRWCQEHLDTGTFQVNDPLPPSGYPADRFDFIFAVSVFTHLAEAHQLQWLGELQRIAAPGGFVLLTVNGEAVWRERATLSEPQRAALETNGHLFVETEFIGEKELPDWYQTAFHTAAYVRETFSRFFTVEAQIPIAMDGQDIVLLRKEARTGSGHLP